MPKKYLIVLLAIVALGAFLRFYQIKEIPLGLYPDEAMNGNNALEAIATGHYKVFYPENNGREGLFINLQAISVALSGNHPWALRIVSALFGTLTILGMYLVTKELFTSANPNDKIPMTKNVLALDIGHSRGEIIALLASFFLATSYWHLNFSRIGFRAIMLPFFATFGMYFLLKGLRRGKSIDLILAGLFTGLGAYTYIAFRFMVFVFAMPVIWTLTRWIRDARNPNHTGHPREKHCTPCNVLLFVFVAFVVLIPIGLYFFGHPQDFISRAGDISIFSAASPAKEFAKSAGLTLQMFFYKGDCNWRHNFACRPALHPLVALFFLIGIIALIRRPITYNLQLTILFVWFSTMMLPAAFTRESVPHALRAIGMIPPVMILAAHGAVRICTAIGRWIAKEKTKWPEKTAQIERVRRELMIFSLLALLTIPLITARNYFALWAYHPETYDAFDTSHLHLGEYLAALPRGTKKYVFVNASGTIVRGIPMPAQTIMFATDTFRDESRTGKNFSYLLSSDLNRIVIPPGQKTIITALNGLDRPFILALQKRFPEMKFRAPSDFVVLQNY